MKKEIVCALIERLTKAFHFMNKNLLWLEITYFNIRGHIFKILKCIYEQVNPLVTRKCLFQLIIVLDLYQLKIRSTKKLSQTKQSC